MYTRETTDERSKEMMISKKMMNAVVIENNAHLFSCPVCWAELELIDKSRLVCTENHSFDLSKQGYVNLTSGSMQRNMIRPFLKREKQ